MHKKQMKAAMAARAEEFSEAREPTMVAVWACVEENGGPTKCNMRVYNGTDPETGVRETFIQLTDKDGGVIATFNDLWNCPPCCPPDC